jgi:hypothetical protein
MCLFSYEVLAIIGAVPFNEGCSVSTVKQWVFSAEKHVELRYDFAVIVFDFMIFDYDGEFLFILL